MSRPDRERLDRRVDLKERGSPCTREEPGQLPDKRPDVPHPVRAAIQSRFRLIRDLGLETPESIGTDVGQVCHHKVVAAPQRLAQVPLQPRHAVCNAPRVAVGSGDLQSVLRRIDRVDPRIG